MKRNVEAALAAAWLFVGTAGIAQAQVPLTGDIVLAARLPGAYFEDRPVAACDRTGACVLVWTGFYTQDSQRADLLAAVLSANGEVKIPAKQLVSTHSLEGSPLAVGLDEGFAVVYEDQSGPGDAVLQYYTEELEPQGDAIRIPMNALYPRNNGIVAVVRTAGGFAIFLGTIDQPPLLTSGLAAAFIDDQGQVTHLGVELNAETNINWSFDEPNSAAAQPDGSLIAVFGHADSSPIGIDMRRVSSGGELLGPERVVASGGLQGLATVAAARDGTFVVAWIRAPRPNRTEEIVAQRFSVRGRPLGQPFRVNEAFGLSQRFPVITVDANDHYFIAWQRFRSKGGPGWDVEGRWFDKFGVPLTREFRLSQQRTSEQQPTPQVAASSLGTIVIGWGSDAFSEKGDESDGVPVARVFAIPR